MHVHQKAVRLQKQKEYPLPESKLAEDRSKQSATIRGHILFVFAVLLALALAWRLRSVLEIVYVSALFAVVLSPLVEHIMKLRVRKWTPSRTLAVILLVLSAFVVLGLFLLIALPPVAHDTEHFAADLPQRIPDMVAKIKRLPMADKFGVDTLAQRGQQLVTSTAQYLFTSAPLWLKSFFDLITAFVLCVYFMLEGDEAYHYFLSFFKQPGRERLARTLKVAEVRMSKWLIGQGSLMLILGVCSTIVFGALHVRYFVLLGVLMGLFNIIPVAGGAITILLAAAVAATDSWTKMAGVFIFYAIYVQVENGYLTPRIMRSSVNLMGLSVLIALIAGTALAGVVGALVSVPTAALVAVLMDEYLVQKDADLKAPDAAA